MENLFSMTRCKCRNYPMKYLAGKHFSLFPGVKPAHAGVALVLVLWLLTLLSIMAAAYGYAMRTETKLTIHGLERAKARAIAEAGLWLAVADLHKPEIKRQWLSDGTRYQLDFGEGRIYLRIQDEAGRIDLNTANDALLRGLLEKAAGPGDDVTFMLHAILDWRDPDSRRRNPGAEDRDYEQVGYGAKDGPFNNIEELRLVAAMTNDMFRKIYPALTVHSRQPGIHPLVAPRDVLTALPGGVPELVDAFLLSRHNREEVATLPPGLDSRYFGGAGGTAFVIASEGVAGRSRLKLNMVITLNKDAHLPYSVLSWRESKPEYHSSEYDNVEQRRFSYGR